MLPVIALLGRPNVGKSTLFNFLTRSRDALVADYPGLTRDRQYGFGKVGRAPYLVVDTGGLSGDEDGIDGLMAQQTLAALEEADVVLMLVDGREGLTAADEAIAQRLRRAGKPSHLLVNKTEGLNNTETSADFMGMGMRCTAISSAHGKGIAPFIDGLLDELGVPTEPQEVPKQAPGIRVAIVGRPNVGKSTLVNRILGEERVVVCDMPGTTRDSVFVPFERDEQQYTLIDTAGVRRRAKVNEVIEKFSVVKTLQAIDQAQVVIMVLDAHLEISDQDASLLGLVMERGRALVIAVNKWDGIDKEQRDRIKHMLEYKLPFLSFAKLHFISALHGSGVGNLFGSVQQAYKAAHRELSTPQLTRVLEAAQMEHQPPLVRGRRVKLRYAHQGGKNPPIIVIHGNQTERLPGAYKRYLENVFRKAFRLQGTPVRIELKTGDNPYEGRRNTLTPRQAAKKKRLMKHIKKNNKK